MKPANSLLLFLLFLSIAFSIVYTPVTKVSLNDGAIGDTSIYTAMHEGKSLQEIPKPFRYRVLVPMLARLVPLPPEFITRGFEVDQAKLIKYKFGIINALFLGLTAWIFFFFCGRLGFTRHLSLIGGLLFLTSFYTINFAGLPLVDSAAYFFLVAVLFAVKKEDDWLLLFLFTIGIFAKETIVIAIIYILFRQASWQKRVRQLLLCIPGLLAYNLLRFVLLPTQIGFNYDANRVLHIFIGNSGSLSSWAFAAINFTFVFGILWVFAFSGLKLIHQRRIHDLLALLPIVPVVFVTPFMIGTDLGRIWFLSFPAIIPLALAGIERFLFKD